MQSISTEIESVQQSLLTIDVENLPIELQEIHTTLNNINRAIENIDIPEYDIATPTSAGLMSAQDKSKLNLIHTTTLVNLDDVLDRLEALETPPDEGGI